MGNFDRAPCLETEFGVSGFGSLGNGWTLGDSPVRKGGELYEYAEIPTTFRSMPYFYLSHKYHSI